MGTPEFSVPSLERLLADGHEVASVFTQPDKPAGRGKTLHQPPVKVFALEHGIPVHQPAKIKTNDEVRAIFESVSPDACVVTAYGKILPAWMLAIPRFGCINVHASLLPAYRGAAPINWAIANGEKETGVTIMSMDIGMDTGPMLAKLSTAIGEQETAPELSVRLSRIGAELLSATLPRVESGEIEPVIQDDGQATYAPMLKREDGRIDWHMNASEISNRVRAFQPWPATYTSFRDGRLTIWRAHAEPQESGELSGSAPGPGSILSIDDAGISVVCSGSSRLLIEEVQMEGKRRISAREFANGAHLKTEERISNN